MNIEKGSISNLQFIILIATHILASDPALAIAEAPSKNIWMVSDYCGACDKLHHYLYFTSLAPGKNLIQINSTIYGRYWGTVFSLSYLFHLTSF